MEYIQDDNIHENFVAGQVLTNWYVGWVLDKNVIEANVSIVFNSSPPSAAYMRQWIRAALFQIMACRLIGAKPLSKPMLGYCHLDP